MNLPSSVSSLTVSANPRGPRYPFLRFHKKLKRLFLSRVNLFLTSAILYPSQVVLNSRCIKTLMVKEVQSNRNICHNPCVRSSVSLRKLHVMHMTSFLIGPAALEPVGCSSRATIGGRLMVVRWE